MSLSLCIGLAGVQARICERPIGIYDEKITCSAKTWVNAFNSLSKANQIYVVGFSMSQYDTMTRFYFSLCMQERKHTPDKIIVIVPEACKMVSTYTNIFVMATGIAKKAEEVDWDNLLKAP